MADSQTVTVQEHRHDTALIVRHNDLIESIHRLDLNQSRFVDWMIGEIRPEDEDLRRYRVSVTKFAEICGLKHSKSNYKMVSDLADRLTRCNVGLRKPKGDKTKASVRYVPWFYAVEYIAGEGAIEAQLHPELKPLVLQLSERFTAVERRISLSIKGDYAKRFYLWLKQYQFIGRRVLSIDWIRECCEMDPGRYQNFADFKKRVIEPAREEIEQLSDIRFEWQPHEKIRKKVISIECTIYPNIPISDPNNITDQDHFADLIKRLTKLGIKPLSVAQELVQKHEPNYLFATIKHYEKQKRKGKAKGPGWLVKAIEENWISSKTLFEKDERQFLEVDQQQRAERFAARREIEQLTEQHQTYKSDLFWQRINDMGPQARKVLDDKFIMYMDAYPYWAAKIDTFKSTGHLDALLQGMYMARNVSNLLTPDELDFTSFARRAKISSTALHLLVEQQGSDKPRPSAT